MKTPLLAALCAALFIVPVSAAPTGSLELKAIALPWNNDFMSVGGEGNAARRWNLTPAAKGPYNRFQLRLRRAVMLNASEYRKLSPQVRHIPVPMMHHYDNGSPMIFQFSTEATF
jgi:hypothetical protein